MNSLVPLIPRLFFASARPPIRRIRQSKKQSELPATSPDGPPKYSSNDPVPPYPGHPEPDYKCVKGTTKAVSGIILKPPLANLS
ncbi:hypothetical protein BJX99DRAFT_227175 [Aspergillus californicus]